MHILLPYKTGNAYPVAKTSLNENRPQNFSFSAASLNTCSLKIC